MKRNPPPEPRTKLRVLRQADTLGRFLESFLPPGLEPVERTDTDMREWATGTAHVGLRALYEWEDVLNQAGLVAPVRKKVDGRRRKVWVFYPALARSIPGVWDFKKAALEIPPTLGPDEAGKRISALANMLADAALAASDPQLPAGVAEAWTVQALSMVETALTGIVLGLRAFREGQG